MEQPLVKGFKVSVPEQKPNQRKGIACTNLTELREKIWRKFYEESARDRDMVTFKVYTDDGTEVDDDEFLMNLPSNSLLLVSRTGFNIPQNFGKSSTAAESIFDEILSLMRWGGGVETVYQEVLKLMQEDFQSKWTHMKENVVDIEDDKTNLSSKLEDPDWFQDLSTKAKTKEEFMFRNSQSRIRGYLYRAEAQISEFKSLTKSEKSSVAKMMETLKCDLKQNDFHGSYFDRGAEAALRICNDRGLFSCEGRYDEDSCRYQRHHTINPYHSYEARILFSTWNLDHLVERSRTVVPAMVKAVKGRKRSQAVNTEYFYSLLFSRDNLKLVHIVCHDKQEHSTRVCDTKLFYIKK